MVLVGNHYLVVVNASKMHSLCDLLPLRTTCGLASQV